MREQIGFPHAKQVTVHVGDVGQHLMQVGYLRAWDTDLFDDWFNCGVPPVVQVFEALAHFWVREISSALMTSSFFASYTSMDVKLDLRRVLWQW